MIQKQPLALNVSIGQIATFTIVATQIGGSSPLYVQWRRNGQNIPGELTLVIPVLGIGTSILTASNVQTSDAGSYSAVVYDSDGAVSSASVDLSITNLLAALVNDTFENRGTLSPLTGGAAEANNLNATKEAGEPNIAEATGRFVSLAEMGRASQWPDAAGHTRKRF